MEVVGIVVTVYDFDKTAVQSIEQDSERSRDYPRAVLAPGGRTHDSLCEGNVLPVVTTTQILLRRHPPYAQIKADGIFGP